MGNPKFSIVIPTRNRAATLRFALMTCLEQRFDDFEVIVSDNFSTPETRQVCEDLNCDRLRYYRSDRPLSMARSFELALSKSSGEWVIFIGDDDGLLPDGLTFLNEFVSTSPFQLIRWDPPYYVWPIAGRPRESSYLRVPIVRGPTWEPSWGCAAIRKVTAFQQQYFTLPSFYHGAVSRSLITKFHRSAGACLFGRYPDVYSSFVLAYLAGQYVNLTPPVTIVGHSTDSNGGHGLRSGSVHPEFFPLHEKDNVLSHPWVGEITRVSLTSSYVAESFWQAKERYFPQDRSLELSRRGYLMHVLQTFRAESLEAWEEGLDLIRKQLEDDVDLRAWFCDHSKRIPPQIKTAATGWEPSRYLETMKGKGLHGGSLHVDGSVLGIHDIHAATKFCGSKLRLDTMSQRGSRIRQTFRSTAFGRILTMPRRCVGSCIRFFCPSYGTLT